MTSLEMRGTMGENSGEAQTSSHTDNFDGEPRHNESVRYVYLVRKKKVNFILSYYTNLSHTGQEKFTSFFRMVYIHIHMCLQINL